MKFGENTCQMVPSVQLVGAVCPNQPEIESGSLACQVGKKLEAVRVCPMKILENQKGALRPRQSVEDVPDGCEQVLLSRRFAWEHHERSRFWQECRGKKRWSLKELTQFQRLESPRPPPQRRDEGGEGDRRLWAALTNQLGKAPFVCETYRLRHQARLPDAGLSSNQGGREPIRARCEVLDLLVAAHVNRTNDGVCPHT